MTLVPITVIMFVLSRRFGALSGRIGPRALMGVGPLLGGLGLIWMGRLSTDVDYVRDLLPAVLLFGLGLSMTVAPLTSTCSAPCRSTTPASRAAPTTRSRASRACSRSRRSARWWPRSSARRSTSGWPAASSARPSAPPCARSGSDRCRAASPGRPELDGPVEAASVHAFRWGMGVGGALMMLGGVISLIGIVNPRRTEAPRRRESHGPAALQVPCPERRREAAQGAR